MQATNLLCRLAMLVCLTTAAKASLAPGTTLKDFPADPSKHVVSVTRTAKDAGEEKLIAAAEGALPERDALLKAADPNQPPAGERLWWHAEQLDIKLPFAITKEAIDYYSEVVTKFGKQEFKGFIQPTSNLTYAASVTSHPTLELDGKTFTNVRVVTMTLEFGQSFCVQQSAAMHFSKERKVVFDANGKILHISGDGPTEAPMMAI